MIHVAVERPASMMSDAMHFAPIQLHTQEFVGINIPARGRYGIARGIGFHEEISRIVWSGDVNCDFPIPVA